MDEYHEISGVVMGRLVDEYITSRGLSRFTNKEEWRKCYKFMMWVLNPLARISDATQWKKARYIEEWVVRELPTTYDKWLYKQAQTGREDENG